MTSPARRTLGRFLQAVMDGDWPEAANHAQVSWAQRTPPEIEDAEYLHAILEDLTVDGFHVGTARRVRQRPNPPSKTICDVEFTVASGDAKLGGLARVIRENGRGQQTASGPGRWGVEPMSILLRLSMLDRQEA